MKTLREKIELIRDFLGIIGLPDKELKEIMVKIKNTDEKVIDDIIKKYYLKYGESE